MKKYISIILICFFAFTLDINAASRYIRIGCETCPDSCQIVSGEYETSEKEGYSPITIPNGFTLYDNNREITHDRIYYTNENRVLFGCDSSEEETQSENNSSNNDSNTTNDNSNTDNKSSANNLIKDGKFNVEFGETESCEDLLGESGVGLIKLGIVALRIITPILLVILSAQDFMNAIPNKDEDEMLKAWKRLEYRAIALVLIILLPTLINLLGQLFGMFNSCGIW